MIALDIRTVVFSHLITDALCTAVLVFLWLQNRKRYEGLSLWVADFGFQTLGVFLLVLRGSIPNWASIGLTDILVVVGAFLSLIGLEYFVGKKSTHVLNYVLLVIFSLVHLYFVLIHPSLEARNLILSLGLLLICGQCVWLLWYRVEQGTRQRTLGVSIVFGFFCLVSLFRIVIILVVPSRNDDFFRSGLYDVLVLLAYQVLLILLTFSLVLLVNNSLVKETRIQEEKFAKAFRSSPYGLMLTRMSDGRILEVNEGFVNLTGYLPDEVIGKTTLDLQLWVKAEDRSGMITELSSGKRVQGKEIEFRRKSGKLMTGLFSAETILIGGQPWILSSISDITERKREHLEMQALLEQSNRSRQALLSILEDRKQAEEKLVASEAQLRALFAAMHDVVLMIDRNGIYRQIAPTNPNLRYRPPEELLGKSLYDVFPPDLAGQFMISIRNVLATKQTVQLEYELTIGERNVWFMTSVTPMDDNTTVWVARDITERRQVEEALRESEERYKKLFELAPVGIAVHSEGKVIFTNPAGVRLLGGDSEDQIIGKSITEIVHPDGLIEAQTRIRKMMSGEPGLYPAEDVYLRLDGTPIDVEVMATPLLHKGKPAVQVIVTDITARKRAEMQLRLQATALEAAANAIAITDHEGIIQWVNPAFTTLTGYTAEESRGRNPRVLVRSGLHDEPFYKNLWDTILAGQVWHGEVINRRKDGTLYTEEQTITPVLGAQGYITHFVAVKQDITERKQAEEALMLRLAQLSAVSQASQAVAISLDLNQVLAEVTSLAGKVTASDYVSIVLVDEAGRVSGGFEDLLGVPTIDYRTRARGLTSWIVRTRQLAVVDEIDTGGRLRPKIAARAPRTANPLLVARGIQSLVGLPLEVEDRIVGVLYLYSLKPGAFRDQLSLLTTFANQAAIAIQKARLYDALQSELAEHKQAEEALNQRAIQLLLINDVSRRVASVMDLEELLNTTASLIHESFGYEHVGIFITNPQQEGELVMKARAGLYASRFPSDHRLQLGEGMVGWVALYDKRLLANDVSVEMRFHDPFGNGSIKAELSVPISSEQGNVGVIDIQSQQKDAFSENDVMVMGTLADVLAAAIHNARLYQELEAYSGVLEQAVKDRTEELSRTKDHIEAILNSVGEAIIVFGTDGRVQQVNPTFERLTGYSAAEVEMHHYDDPQIAMRLSDDVFRQVLEPRGGHGWHGEMQVCRRDSTTFDSAVSISPVYDTQGKVVAFVGAMRDISPLKEVERMKDAFVSNVSHELRTPITSLKLLHHLLEANPQKQSNYVEQLGRTINRLNVLIEDLLRLSRLEQGRVVMNIAPINLNTLVAQYVTDFTLLASSRQLTLTFEGSPSEPTVQADQGLLGQVLSVLLTNALNYTPAGGKVVVSTLVSDREEQSWAGFSVSDTGPGIPPEEQQQLFQRFFRGSTGRASGAPGTGLGLAIAREIIDRHGGRLVVKSEGIPGEGTAFTVWLPAGNMITDEREEG